MQSYGGGDKVVASLIQTLRKTCLSVVNKLASMQRTGVYRRRLTSIRPNSLIVGRCRLNIDPPARSVNFKFSALGGLLTASVTAIWRCPETTSIMCCNQLLNLFET